MMEWVLLIYPADCIDNDVISGIEKGESHDSIIRR